MITVFDSINLYASFFENCKYESVFVEKGNKYFLMFMKQGFSSHLYKKVPEQKPENVGFESKSLLEEITR
jgi:hypothetical protein